MKKTLLALAVAALSANAFAVSLDDNTATQNYASEIVVASSGTVLQGATASVTAGFALATDGYVRFELTNGAKFEGTPTLTSVPNTSLYSVSAGGAGSDYVIFRTNGNGILITDVLTLAGSVKVSNKNAVSVSYALYETAANAVAESGALASKTGTLLNFKSAVKVAATDAVKTNIDAINGESKEFVAGTTTDLTNLSTGVDTSVLLASGAPVAALNDIANSYTWTLNGNFSAVEAAGINDATPVAFTIAADKQSASLQDAADGVVTYEVTGADEIAETTVSAVFSADAKTGYAISNVTINNAAVLTKNGVTRDVDLALKPGGAYSNYVRISNKDTIAGGFSIRVINDAGEAVSFPLNAVAGQPATLDAGASTAQMTIQSIFDAAVAKGLTLSGEGKLRLQVTGQVNDLDVQTYTVSKDGNSFATF